MTMMGCWTQQQTGGMCGGGHNHNHTHWVEMAKLAEMAGRYCDMVVAVKNVVATAESDLTVEEINLLSIAYKNEIGARRLSLKVISAVEPAESAKASTPFHSSKLKEFLQTVRAELVAICKDLLDLLDTHLIPSAASADSEVCYYNMKGSYSRYLAENSTGPERKNFADISLSAFRFGLDIAERQLPATHSTRLSLAFNLSAFFYDILGSDERSSETAKKAYNAANALWNTLTPDYQRDITLVMQLLHGQFKL
ncbi:tyrosine 3-monooxygenase/tryptophan 5-monooxygenase activation protein, epsilon polypeptide 2 [Pelomyxa schiedti]|nr:tyrosine 3-monooxygenase/tryptophan 5-monooxygenase activation protein, epsilon polypeptide 2 [Pelomyxa schiedti]